MPQALRSVLAKSSAIAGRIESNQALHGRVVLDSGCEMAFTLSNASLSRSDVNRTSESAKGAGGATERSLGRRVYLRTIVKAGGPLA